MTSTHTIVSQLILLISIVNANLLSPTDLVVGKWNLQFSRRDHILFETMIFPPRKNTDDWFKTDPNWMKIYLGGIHEDGKLSSSCPPRSWLMNRFKSLNCELVLHFDGSFELKPMQVRTCQTNFQNKSIDVLKGWWYLRPNPYCVTDRQYDELTLISHPKMRIYGARRDPKTREILNPLLEQHEEVTIELNCKIWGRYGSNSIRRAMKFNQGRNAGRISHGILNIVKTDADVHQQTMNVMNSKKKRILCATFCGTAE